jgi:hypothetical protein
MIKTSGKFKHLVAGVQDIGWGGIESQCDDNIETHKHSTLQVVGFAILDNIRNNEDRNSEGNSLDWEVCQ